MRVTGLDGRSYHMLLRSAPRNNASLPHQRARALLEQLFPAEPRLEEVPLPGTGGLFADFYLPARRMLVEVQGRQHREYTPHFHGGLEGLARSRLRDSRKAEFAALNGLSLAYLEEGREDEWPQALGFGNA